MLYGMKILRGIQKAFHQVTMYYKNLDTDQRMAIVTLYGVLLTNSKYLPQWWPQPENSDFRATKWKLGYSVDQRIDSKLFEDSNYICIEVWSWRERKIWESK